MITIVFGIQGVGKSTIVKGILNKMHSGWEHKQWGDLMFEQALAEKVIAFEGDTIVPVEEIYSDNERGVKIVVDPQGSQMIRIRAGADLKAGKDEIRYLDQKTQLRLQKAIGDTLAVEIESNPQKNFLIETHAALKTKQGYLPGLSTEFLTKVKPDLYIIIEARADEIFVRRLTDKTRKREHDKTTQDIQINLDVTRYFAGSCAVISHSPLFIVQNKEKLQEDAVNELAEVLNSFRS